MPASPVILGTLVQVNVAAKMEDLSGVDPQAQLDPSYFIAMTQGIGVGIATGSVGITFTTEDDGDGGIPPVPGVGAGVGIVVDDTFFAQEIYTKARNKIIDDFGSTAHEVYPPSSGNSGEYLLAVCEGVAESVKDHFALSFIHTSTHPTVYSGTGVIPEGGYIGLVPSVIESLIIAATPTLLGSYWASFVNVVANAFVETISNHSTGEVTITGVCVPLVPPAGSQLCALPVTGSGSGITV